MFFLVGESTDALMKSKFWCANSIFLLDSNKMDFFFYPLPSAPTKIDEGSLVRLLFPK